MKRSGLWVIAALTVTAVFSTAAMAEGEGRYSVNGTDAKDHSNYQGTATLTKTGNMTWQMIEVIGSDTIEGFGVGDGKVIAVSFDSGGAATVAVYIANSDGSYTGMWAGEDDKDISTETLKPQ
jgi:beta-glucanase (GH16 family)